MGFYVSRPNTETEYFGDDDRYSLQEAPGVLVITQVDGTKRMFGPGAWTWLSEWRDPNGPNPWPLPPG